MQLEQRKRFLINFAYFAVILGITVLLTRYALGVLAPFLVALVVSLLLKPVVTFLREKAHFRKGLAGALVVLVFYALIVLLLIVLRVQIFTAAKSFFLTLPALYTGSVAPWLSARFADLQAFAAKLDPEAAAAYNVVASNVTSTLGQTIANVSKSVVAWVTGITLKTPKFLLNLLISVIATVFLSIDFPKIKAFILLQFSEKNRDLLYSSLTELGYRCIHPDGAFYLFVKSPEPDARAFCRRALGYELLFVPGDDFGCPGYVRIAYCVPRERIERAMPAFRALAESYR